MFSWNCHICNVRTYSVTRPTFKVVISKNAAPQEIVYRSDFLESEKCSFSWFLQPISSLPCVPPVPKWKRKLKAAEEAKGGSQGERNGIFKDHNLAALLPHSCVHRSRCNLPRLFPILFSFCREEAVAGGEKLGRKERRERLGKRTEPTETFPVQSTTRTGSRLWNSDGS